MGYSVQYSKDAEKFLDKQPKQVRKRIMDAVDKLPNGEIKKLKGRKGYRLVVGDFRVLYDFIKDEGNCIFDIASIGPRGDVYKK
jgi:mRNA interferase RelE/StbE